MSLSTVVQHTAVLSAKCALFVFCRKYLLDSLYKDLRSLSYNEDTHLSTGAGSTDHASDGELELDPLPTSSSRVATSRSMPSPLSAVSGLFPLNRKDTGSMQSDLARILFSLCFEEGCSLFLLVMCQAVDILAPTIRRNYFRTSLGLLAGLVVVIIPLVQCLLFTYRAGLHRKKQGTRIALTALPYLLYIVAFFHVPLPSNSDGGFFTNALVRMNVLGTVILGLLSGFGAVSTAWSFQPFSKTSEVVTERDVASASDALERVRSDLLARQSEARRSGVLDQGSSWFSTSFFKGNPGSALLLEIDGLRALESQMTRNLEALRLGLDEREYRKTWQGRIWVIFGKAFAVYCVIRIISSIRNVIFGPSSGSSGTSSPDIVTYLIARFAALFPKIPLSQDNVASLARQISLFLVGCIILSSVRTVLWQVGRLVKSNSKTTGAAFLLLFLAQLMGIYLLSTLIQLRTSFPPSKPPPITTHPDESTDSAEPTNVARDSEPSSNLFASLPEYQLFGMLFDGSFLLAAAVTSATIWAQRQLTRAEVFR